jgi:hypothetical protein
MVGSNAAEPSSAVHRLDRKLRELERADGSLLVRRKAAVFGARQHAYKRRSVRDADVFALEHDFGIVVAEELKTIWAVIGAGVGPYYGLLGPKEIIAELTGWAFDAAEAGRSLQLGGQFPLAWPLEGTGPVARIGPTPGCIPIAHQGDNIWSTLVLTGSEAGHVWDFAEFIQHDWQWVPGGRPPGTPRSDVPRLPPFGSPPSVFEWYEGWLDQALATI